MVFPADYCYNRTNEGIDFEKHSHLFEKDDDGSYVVLSIFWSCILQM
ncbi:DUF7225 domain-containing protein [Anaerococcus vaginalis]